MGFKELPPSAPDGPLNDMLNLCSIPRWTVCRMSQPQSVAEHSFRVAVIAAFIAHCLGFDPSFNRQCVAYGLIHDASEAYTSDPPAPFKDVIGRELFNAAEDRMVPWLVDAKSKTPNNVKAIVKIADQVEGYTWWRLFGDYRMAHPWITSTGPQACNSYTLITTCDKFIPILGDTREVIIRIVKLIMGRGADGQLQATADSI